MKLREFVFDIAFPKELPKLAWAALAVILAYFPVAIHLRTNFVPAQVQFEKYSLWAYIWKFPELDSIADTPDHPAQSPIMVYENGKPLGPAHRPPGDVGSGGGGKFSHWKGVGIIFSTSDNSNPNFNAKHYSISK